MEIQDRTLRFSIRIVKFVKQAFKSMTLSVLAGQLLRSATSVGANLKEADSASSKRDFANKVIIAKKEAQETEYWLEVIKGAELMNNDQNKKELNYLLMECHEIILILGAIHRKVKQTIISH